MDFSRLPDDWSVIILSNRARSEEILTAAA